MDRPVLYGLVERVRAEERLQRFAEALPTRARVSELVLPLVVASLYDEVGRGLIVALAEDTDARDVAEAAGWFLGDETVALFPSRGVRWESGLEPPPHLIGERARALDVFERGGLVCVSATALAEGMPPVSARPSALRIAQGDEPGIDGLAAELADAGYERVERVEERGQFAVRGGLVDVYPTTGASRSGSSSSETRSSRSEPSRRLRSGRSGRSKRRRSIRLPNEEASWSRSRSPTTTSRFAFPTISSRPSTGLLDLVWSPDDVRAVWDEESLAPVSLVGATELSALPQAQPFSFDAQRPALAARGLSEAENELNGLLRQELDIVVAFPHRGEALRQSVAPPFAGAPARAGEGPAGSSSPCRPRAAASSGVSSDSRCSPIRRCSGDVLCVRPRRLGAPCRASPISAPVTTSCTKTTALHS